MAAPTPPSDSSTNAAESASNAAGSFLGDFSFGPWITFVIVIVAAIAGLRLIDFFLLRRPKLTLDERLPRQITMLALTVLAIVVVILALPGGENGPITNDTRNQLLAFLGLAVTATLTLSSTTLAANGMAGLMIRATAPFRGGDWIRVNDHFGRVTDRGLFHTEIQTEDRDLLSLPNLLLATNPVRIVQHEGTVVSAEVSLGYATPHGKAEDLLIKAAEETGLEEPFVWLMDLKDHVVVYRIAGMLKDVKSLITTRSTLRANILDTLHEAGVEIASPSIMLQKRVEPDQEQIPSTPNIRTGNTKKPAEEKIFDKAEEAARIDELEQELEKLKEERKESSDTEACERLDDKISGLEDELNEAKQAAKAKAKEKEPAQEGSSPA